MDQFSILIGGKAGDGIDKSSMVIASIFNRLGYYIYVYRDYPSIIRGGHTFSIIRASKNKIFTHNNKVDVILAINRETIDLHIDRLKPASTVVYDPKIIKEPPSLKKEQKSLEVLISEIIKEEDAPPVTSNSIMIGALAKVLGVNWSVLEEVFKEKLPKETEKNLAVARRGYSVAKTSLQIKDLKQKSWPLLSGNEALGLGLIKGGLQTYIAYPMTPTSNILHFMAENADNFKIKVIHPESEISVILMALGCSYANELTAVGTSGGGFCLMTEGLSLSGMAELPVVVIVGQRPGPSTGLPTYSSQTDLNFVLNAGHGEFTRLVVAPGDSEESYLWAQISIALAAKYKIPALILTDKNLGEGVFSFDKALYNSITPPELPKNETKDIFKVNSYEHDENGITTEDPIITKKMQEKRLAKTKELSDELDKYETVGVYGNKDSTTAILCWGSNKGLCIETAQSLGLKVVQVKVMRPFPIKQFRKAIKGVEKLIAVENNATGQLVGLINAHGFNVGSLIAKYDGRSTSIDEMKKGMSEILKEKT